MDRQGDQSTAHTAAAASPARWRRVLASPTVWIFVTITIAGAALIVAVNELGGPEQVRHRFGLIAPLISVSVHIVLALTPFPSDAVAVANGVVYGFWSGTALSWIGWWCAGVAEFALGRRARQDFCLETALSDAPGWVRSFPVSHPAFLILSRQIPWLGGHISTFVPGAASVSWRRFLCCSAIAILPACFLMSAIGTGIKVLPFG